MVSGYLNVKLNNPLDLDNFLPFKKTFLLFTAVLGAVITFSCINYQPWVSTGDHGLLLYAADRTLHGDLPYRDYHYYYGPLMPYYYALFLKLFGNQIGSVLIGKALLELMGGILIYLSLSIWVAPVLSALAACWYWIYAKDFFYTYNHAGIITMSLAVFYCLLLYSRSRHIKAAYFSLILAVITGLIKLNFGVILCVEITAVLFLLKLLDNQPERKPAITIYILAGIISPIIILLLNSLFVLRLDASVIKQCFQYFDNDAKASLSLGIIHNTLFLIKEMWAQFITKWYGPFFVTLGIILAGAQIIFIKEKRVILEEFKKIAAPIGISIIFIIFHLHEYLLSGVYFRSFYAEGFIIIFLFFLFSGGMANLAKPFSGAIYGILFISLLLQFNIQNTYLAILKRPWHFLALPKGNIYTGNHPRWTRTVMQTVIYLQKNLRTDELFFVLPYDPLYYYLTDKKSPVRDLTFFKFNETSLEQERAIIKTLEEEKVNWVVLSNRSVSANSEEGAFGTTHCKLLNEYINSRFEIVEKFGVWEKQAGWIENHATRILKRRLD